MQTAQAPASVRDEALAIMARYYARGSADFARRRVAEVGAEVGCTALFKLEQRFGILLCVGECWDLTVEDLANLVMIKVRAAQFLPPVGEVAQPPAETEGVPPDAEAALHTLNTAPFINRSRARRVIPVSPQAKTGTHLRLVATTPARKQGDEPAAADCARRARSAEVYLPPNLPHFPLIPAHGRFRQSRIVLQLVIIGVYAGASGALIVGCVEVAVRMGWL